MSNSEQLIKDLTEQNTKLRDMLIEINNALSNSVLFLGEIIKTFESHSEFINFDKALLKQFYDKDDRIICLDKNGNCCNIPVDFDDARDKDSFPVKVYRLIRTSDVKK